MLFLIDVLLLQSIPVTSEISAGIKAASNSSSIEVNKILTAIILVLVLLKICVVKYLIKDKKDAVVAAREDSAKEQAINNGHTQQVIEAKDKTIKYLTIENEKIKLSFETIMKDNTEVYRQLVTKVGSFVEGQAVVAANQEKNKSEILLEINRLFSSLRNG